MSLISLQNAVSEVLDTAVRNAEAAGINFLVLLNGEEYLYAQSGCRDLDRKKPVSKDTIFRLYSMSKPVTSAAVMKLFEEGKIDLYDPVSKYLPGFEQQFVAQGDQLVPVSRPCNLHDLLSMASGMVYNGPDPVGQAADAVFQEAIKKMDTPSAMTTLEIADALARQPLKFHPGTHFNYGTSADILGAVVEAVSGMKFGDFLKKYFFDPLGMKDTGFFLPESSLDRLALTYESTPQGLAELKTTHLAISYTMDRRPAFESGGAGLVSTLPDYARFASMLINMGSYEGKEILKPATVRFMTGGSLMPCQQADLDRDWTGLAGYTYGNLLRVMQYPERAGMLTSPGEYGWDGWLGTYFSNHPTLGLTILMGIQKKDAGTTAVTRKLRNLVLSEFL